MPLTNFLQKMLMSKAFETEKGRIVTFGRIFWILFPARAMAIMLQKIGEKNGKEHLYNLGYAAGKDFGEEIADVLGFKLKGGRVVESAVLSLTEFAGFGTVKIVRWNIEKNGRHLITLKIENNPVVERSKTLYGKKSMACTFFRGVFSAHAQLETYAKNVKFVEKTCVCKKGLFCEWESKW